MCNFCLLKCISTQLRRSMKYDVDNNNNVNVKEDGLMQNTRK